MKRKSIRITCKTVRLSIGVQPVAHRLRIVLFIKKILALFVFYSIKRRKNVTLACTFNRYKPIRMPQNKTTKITNQRTCYFVKDKALSDTSNVATI